MIIIIGRWLLPKGKISRSALSQLLLVYLSLASDMIDLLSIFQEDKVIRNSKMIYSTLAVFSWSTFQFSLNLVASRGRTFRFDAESINSNNQLNLIKQQKRRRPQQQILSVCHKLANSELPSIFLTILMQDLPFLVIRLIAVVHFKVQSYTTIFFTCKNLIILCLQVYRLWSICIEHIHQEEPNNNVDKYSITAATIQRLPPLPESATTQFILA